MTKTFSYAAMPEQEVLIDLPATKDLKIKGLLRGSYDQPLAILIHGLPGHGNELLPYLFARYLAERGIASLRLWLYDFHETTRDLMTSSLDTNAQDLAAVASYLRDRQVPRLFAVGHSYGGLAILKTDAHFDAAVLWDPTHGLAFQRTADKTDYGVFPEETRGRYIITTSGCGLVTTDELKQYNLQLGDTTELAAGKAYPIKLIAAGKGIMTDLGRRYIEAADEPKACHVIKDAHHQFEDSDAIVLELFSQSYDWLHKYE